MTIKELCVKHGSNKTPEYSQSFTPVYDFLLSKLENVENVLEVGVGYRKVMQKYIPFEYKPGASLRVWRDYCPKAYVWGFDIDKRASFENEERMSFVLVDSTDSQQMSILMNVIGKQFDLIVDDGDHTGGGQIATALNLLPHMKKGGMYFIEDVKKVSKVMEALKDYKPFLFDWTVNSEGNDRLIFIQL
jgi:hypothetical protein